MPLISNFHLPCLCDRNLSQIYHDDRLLNRSKHDELWELICNSFLRNGARKLSNAGSYDGFLKKGYRILPNMNEVHVFDIEKTKQYQNI